LLLLGDVRLVPALCASGLLVVGLILSTLKWQVLLVTHEIRLPFLRLLRYYWIGSFFSNFLPSNVGGDVFRLTLLYKQESLPIIGASIVVERLTGLCVLLCLAVLGLCIVPEYFDHGQVLLAMWLLVLSLSGAVGIAVTFGARVETWLGTLLKPDRLVGRVALALIEVTKALTYYRQQTKAISLAVVISIYFYAVMIGFHYSVILAIEANLSLLDVALIAPLIALVSFVPISVNALGLAEGAFVLFFTQAGLSPEEALAAAVLRRLLILGYSLIGGVIWVREKSSLRSPQ
jgi:uncharacterized protein (TIRG00374 family)